MSDFTKATTTAAPTEEKTTSTPVTPEGDFLSVLPLVRLFYFLFCCCLFVCFRTCMQQTYGEISNNFMSYPNDSQSQQRSKVKAQLKDRQIQNWQRLEVRFVRLTLFLTRSSFPRGLLLKTSGEYCSFRITTVLLSALQYFNRVVMCCHHSANYRWISYFPCTLTRNITRHIMKNLAFIANSDEKWLCYQLSLSQLNIFLWKVGRMYCIGGGVNCLGRIVSGNYLSKALFIWAWSCVHMRNVSPFN